MKFLNLKYSKSISVRLDKYPDGNYWVTKDIDRHRIAIKKPGVKPGYPKDIAVTIHYPEGNIKPPTHPRLVADYSEKYNTDPKLGKLIFEQLERLQNDEEPNTVRTPKGRSGLPVPILIHALKWIWIQEDRNYPPPKMGKRMNWSSYILINYGNLDKMSSEAKQILIEHGYSEKEIDTIRYRSGSKHLR